VCWFGFLCLIPGFLCVLVAADKRIPESLLASVSTVKD
jgi:hypothetical protein